MIIATARSMKFFRKSRYTSSINFPRGKKEQQGDLHKYHQFQFLGIWRELLPAKKKATPCSTIERMKSDLLYMTYILKESFNNLAIGG